MENNNWIESIILKPIEYGSSAGVLSFHITFTGSAPENRAVAMAEVVCRMVHSGFNIKNVTLQGRFPDQDLMLTFVMALREPGFMIHAIIDHTTYYYWLGTSTNQEERLVKWITLDLHTIAWSGFAVNEVLYHITNVNDPEPILPTGCRVLYLIPPDELPKADIIKFLKNSKNRWHINLKNDKLKKYEVVV